MASKNKGFTLPEVAVVVAIIGVLAMMMGPNLERTLSHYRLQGAAREIAMNLQYLRIKSMSTENQTRLDFTPGTVTLNDGFYTAFVDLDADGTHDAPTETDATKLKFTDSMAGYNGIELPTDVSFGWGTWGVNVTKQACSGTNTSQPTSAVTFNGQTARFEPTGTDARAGTIYLESESNNEFYAVSVSLTGNVKSCRWTGSAWE